MSGKAVVAILAVAAVGGAAWWFATKGKKRVAKRKPVSPRLAAAKADADEAFKAFERATATPSATPAFANYDAYYAQQMAWAQSQPPAYRAQLPPPPMSPQQARAAFQTTDQLNNYQRQYAAQVQQVVDRVYLAQMAGQQAQPTVLASRAITAAETSGPAMAVAAADLALAQWRQNTAFMAAQGVPTLPPPQPTQIPDFSSQVAASALRQNYAAAADWFGRYGSLKTGVTAPPALPLGLPA